MEPTCKLSPKCVTFLLEEKLSTAAIIATKEAQGSQTLQQHYDDCCRSVLLEEIAVSKRTVPATMTMAELVATRNDVMLRSGICENLRIKYDDHTAIETLAQELVSTMQGMALIDVDVERIMLWYTPKLKHPAYAITGPIN
jgi:hypothetical protein